MNKEPKADKPPDAGDRQDLIFHLPPSATRRRTAGDQAAAEPAARKAEEHVADGPESRAESEAPPDTRPPFNSLTDQQANERRSLFRRPEFASSQPFLSQAERWRRRKIWIGAAAVLFILLALVPPYFRVYTVQGASDAPNFLLGDYIFVNNTAYDVHYPYSDKILFKRSDPRPGDVVLFRQPDNSALVFKRVLGRPGDTIAMEDNRLIINGQECRYRTMVLDQSEVDPDNRLGETVQLEIGPGFRHLITYTPEAGTYRTFRELTLAANEYFVIGDNRDNSFDSRMYGPVERSRIIGRVQ